MYTRQPVALISLSASVIAALASIVWCRVSRDEWTSSLSRHARLHISTAPNGAIEVVELKYVTSTMRPNMFAAIRRQLTSYRGYICVERWELILRVPEGETHLGLLDKPDVSAAILQYLRDSKNVIAVAAGLPAEARGSPHIVTYWHRFIAAGAIPFAVVWLVAAATIGVGVVAARWWRRGGQCCARCGYDLSGLASLPCPECGSPPTSPPA